MGKGQEGVWAPVLPPLKRGLCIMDHCPREVSTPFCAFFTHFDPVRAKSTGAKEPRRKGSWPGPRAGEVEQKRKGNMHLARSGWLVFQSKPTALTAACNDVGPGSLTQSNARLTVSPIFLHRASYSVFRRY